MLISKQVILTFLVTLGAYGEVLAQQPELGTDPVDMARVSISFVD